MVKSGALTKRGGSTGDRLQDVRVRREISPLRGLFVFEFVSPGLTAWANECRAYGAEAWVEGRVTQGFYIATALRGSG
jgi:hypothetical protein